MASGPLSNPPAQITAIGERSATARDGRPEKSLFFFFKQKTAYDIGLGIPAEPLFRSQIAINGHIKFNLTIPLQQLNGLETLVIIMVANKYAFLQITRRRFLNEWEAFKKVISRRNIRRRITIPLTLSNLKLLRRI